MHLSEGMLPATQSLVWSAIALPTLIWSIRAERSANQGESSSVMIMSSVTSVLFAATLLPLPVPIVGATSHICLTPLFALIVGLRRIIWPTFFVLLIQALFFAHGGITTLGVNMITLGVCGPLVTCSLWWLLRKMGQNNPIGLGIICGLGGLSVYVVDALVLAMSLSDVAPPSTTFLSIIVGFAPVQVPLSILESVVSVKIIQVIAERRLDLLPTSLQGFKQVHPSVGLILLLLVSSSAMQACSYEGIDNTVFGATAEGLGRTPTDSILDFSQGELGLAVSILILFGMGFVAGRTWESHFSREKDALSR